MRDGMGCFLIVLMTFTGFMSGKRYERDMQARREAKVLSESIPAPPSPDEYYFGQSVPFGKLEVGDSFKMSDGSTGTVRVVYHDGPKMSGVLVERNPPADPESVPGGTNYAAPAPGYEGVFPPPAPRPGDLQ